MGCNCNKQQNKRMQSKEHVQKIADRYTEVTGTITIVHVKIVDGEEVFDFMTIEDMNGNIIEKQDEQGNKKD